MFEQYSKTFESVFRIIFIIWVSLWGTIDLANLVINYISFGKYQKVSELGYWLSGVFGLVVGLSTGITLLFLMVNIPSLVSRKKKITTIPLMLVLIFFYYLFVTLTKILASAIFRPENFTRSLVFLVAWLLPSIVIMIIHIFYIQNLRRYNQLLGENNVL